MILMKKLNDMQIANLCDSRAKSEIRVVTQDSITSNNLIFILTSRDYYTDHVRTK